MVYRWACNTPLITLNTLYHKTKVGVVLNTSGFHACDVPTGFGNHYKKFHGHTQLEQLTLLFGNV